MLSGFVLAFREGLEAALILSIVLGVVVKQDRRQLYPLYLVGRYGGDDPQLGLRFFSFPGRFGIGGHPRGAF
jgi:hypothetical protein